MNAAESSQVHKTVDDLEDAEQRPESGYSQDTCDYDSENRSEITSSEGNFVVQGLKVVLMVGVFSLLVYISLTVCFFSASPVKTGQRAVTLPVVEDGLSSEQVSCFLHRIPKQTPYLTVIGKCCWKYFEETQTMLSFYFRQVILSKK